MEEQQTLPPSICDILTDTGLFEPLINHSRLCFAARGAARGVRRILDGVLEVIIGTTDGKDERGGALRALLQRCHWVLPDLCLDGVKSHLE